MRAEYSFAGKNGLELQVKGKRLKRNCWSKLLLEQFAAHHWKHNLRMRDVSDWGWMHQNGRHAMISCPSLSFTFGNTRARSTERTNSNTRNICSIHYTVSACGCISTFNLSLFLTICDTELHILPSRLSLYPRQQMPLNSDRSTLITARWSSGTLTYSWRTSSTKGHTYSSPSYSYLQSASQDHH